MAPHFLFVLPIATAFLLREVKGHSIRLTIVALTAYLLTYNGILLTHFLFSPIQATL